MRNDELCVWLDDSLVATLIRTRTGTIRLRYTDESVSKFGENAIVMSVALPTSMKRYDGTPVELWADSLLPEGETRTLIEGLFGVRRGDTFGLLAAIGGDCAGALSFLPEASTPQATTASSQPLQGDELEAALTRLDSHPLGVDDDVRVSLGGLQAKLLLTRTPDGGWARPAGGAPSTHIAKPDPDRFPGLVSTEAFTLALAGSAGIRAADHRLEHWGDRPVLLVERFDRSVHGQQVRRLHQEDACSALGVNPTGPHKYQSQDPKSPSLARIAKLLSVHGTERPRDLVSLAKQVTLRLAVGDTDGHARNYGLLHVENALELAPLYDAAPTSMFVSAKQMGLWADGQSYLRAVTRGHLEREFRSWGMPTALAESLPAETLSRLKDSVPLAVEATPGVDEKYVEAIAERITGLLER